MSTNTNAISSAKTAKVENGARSVDVSARRITQKLMLSLVATYNAMDPETRAQKVAAGDDDALLAEAYIARCSAGVREAETLQAQQLADKLVARAKKTLAASTARDRLKNAMKAARECILILSVAAVKRPGDPRIQSTLLQSIYNGTGHPVSDVNQPMVGLKTTDNVAALNNAKNLFYAFLSSQPQSDEVHDDDLGWTWGEVRVCAITGNVACVQPLVVNGHASFGGAWAQRKMIGVPLREDTPLLYVMPAGYDHDRREEYMQNRIDAAAAELPRL